MSERRPSYASQVIFLVYLAGAFYSGPTDWNWSQIWRAGFWPMVIAAEFVPPVIERLADEATAPDALDPSP